MWIVTILHLTVSSLKVYIHFTRISHERVDSRFLVLPGSESTITKITEQSYFSLILTAIECKYKSD